MTNIQQLLEEKKILSEKPKEENKSKNTWTPNELLVYSDYAEIFLRNNKQELVGVAKIDLEDIDKVKNSKWHITKSGYCEGEVSNKQIRLHRFLMNAKKGEILHHINSNRLDNRKSNLEFTTTKENNTFKNIVRGSGEMKPIQVS